ncbi:MAG: 4-alpha-glucanotransferase [Thermodesulfobacteriota bacterium]
MTDQEPALLARLAQACGILPGYHDLWGAYHPAGPETLRALLRSLGADVSSPEALERELREREGAPARRLVEPVTVLPEGGEQVLRLQAPPSEAAWEVRVSVRGRNVPVRLLGAETAQGPDGRVTLPVAFSPPLPAGLHELQVCLSSPLLEDTGRTLCAVAPARGHEPEPVARGGRLWGVNLPLYGLRSARNWGVGDFRNLLDAVEWAADLGADIVGVLPLHALFNEPPYGVSPYYPSSRLWLNPLHIAVDALPEAAAPAAAAFLEAPETRAEQERLRGTELVDHQAAWALKRRALELCFGAFREGNPRRRAAFDAWRRAQGQALEEFAAFEALREHLGREQGGTRPWPQWPAAYRKPDAPAVRAFAARAQEAVGFRAWLQWVAETQLARCQARARELGMAVGLYLDLALGVDPCGADAWVYQDVLALGASAGAPPDPFSLMGQRWGVPPPIPDRHRETGYAFLRDTVERSARRAGALRIDHVLALWRLFWVPGELPASAGAYVEDRAEELLAVLRCLSREHGCAIVGEDLGTIPPEVRVALAASGFYGYRLLIFEKHGDGRYRAPGEYPRQALVSVATHDLPTVDGFWLGRDLEVKARLRQYPTPEAERGDAEGRRWDCLRLLDALAAEGLLPPGVAPAHEVPESALEALAGSVHAFLARTPAALLLANLDDLLGGREMQNLPGTLSEHPNWRRKCLLPVEEWSRFPRARRIAEAIWGQGRGRPPGSDAIPLG